MRSSRILDRSAEMHSEIRYRLPALVTLLGICASLLAACVELGAHGLYASEVQVWFVAPKSTENPNGLQISGDSLVMTAGAVRRMVTNSDPPRTSAADVPLSGEGVKRGYSVTLPNTGGQWTNRFTNAYLDVQVVDSNAPAVSTKTRQLIAEINASLAALEQRAQVAQVNQIRTQVVPASGGIPVHHEHGSRMRALLATIALGLGLTLGARTYVTRRFGAGWVEPQKARSMPRTSLRWVRANIE
jgi:hypothetical protein